MRYWSWLLTRRYICCVKNHRYLVISNRLSLIPSNTQTNLSLIWATITLIKMLHTYTRINRFSCKLLSTEKCCFCPFEIEQALVSLHGFREQSKRSKGFHSNKTVEKHWFRMTRLRCWWGIGLAIYRSLVRILAEHHCVMTLGKLLTPVCICHQPL